MSLVLAALAALGWGAAFYALFDNFEIRSSVEADIAELEAENARLAARVDAQGELATVEAEIRRAREELVATLDRRRDLEENIAALHTDIASLGGEATAPGPASVPDGDETQARANSLNLALARLDRTVGERSSELAQISRAREEAEARLDAASRAADEIDRRRDARARELAATEQRLSALLADIERLDGLSERRAAAAREEVEALAARRAQLAADVEELETARGNVATEEERLAALRREAERESALLAQTRREVARLQGEVARARSELAAPRRDAEPARSRIEERPDGSRVIRVTPGLN